MAFGGLEGLTPQEVLRRYGVNPSPIPWGIANFHPSQLSGNFTQPANISYSRLPVTPAQAGLGPVPHLGTPPMSILDYDRAMGMSRPLPTRIPGRFAPSFGPQAAADVFQMNPSAIGSSPRWQAFSLGRGGMPPDSNPGLPWANPTPPLTPPTGRSGLAPSRSAVESAQRRQAALARQATAAAGTTGSEAIALGQGRNWSTVPGTRPQVVPQFPLGLMRNGPGSIPMGAGGTVPTASPIPPAGVGPALPRRVPGATLPQATTRLSAMQLPRPPGAATPVSIRSRAASVAPEAAAAAAATPAAAAAASQAVGMRNVLTGRGALAAFGQHSGLRGAGIRGAGSRLLGRGLLASLAMSGASAVGADPFNTGTDDSAWQQAIAGGTAAGAPAYVLGGPVAGGVAGVVGAGANLLTGGQFTESLGNLMGSNPTGHDAIQQQFGESDPQVAALLDERLTRLESGAENMWEGVPDEVANQLAAYFNELAPGLEGEELAALQAQLAMAAETAAQEAVLAEQQQAQQETALSPADLAATQALASQFMAPVAADSVAIGQMGATALQNLARGLPAGFGEQVRNMADTSLQGGQNMANAYMQQAYAIPQNYVMDRQQGIQDQIASMLMSQAIGSLPQFSQSTGAMSFDDIVAAQAAGGATAGGTGDPAADMAALIAQGG